MESIDTFIERNYKPSSYDFKNEYTHTLLTKTLVHILKEQFKL